MTQGGHLVDDNDTEGFFLDLPSQNERNSNEDIEQSDDDDNFEDIERI